ncbi:hypothetical protein ScPMuIL_016427 [Solemya velum]
MTHLKRAEGKAGPRVLFAPSMPLKSKKEQFLANIENKQQFINLLSEKMNEKGIRTVSAEGDADVLITETGVKCSAEGFTYVIGEDTDVLVLLCHYSKDDSKGLLFRSDRKTSKICDISLVRQTFSTELCRMLPVIHYIGGCDTTSRLFGIGKGSALKKTQTVMSFKEQIGILCESELNTVEVQNAGEKLLAVVVVGMVLSGDSPKACKEKYEDWKFFKRFSELERYLRLMRCLSTYCKTGKAFYPCIIRHSAQIHIQYFVE